MQDDKELIEKILNGNINAFQLIIEKYQRLVSHIVFKMIKSEKDREDLCQDIFLKIYHNLAKFRFEANFSTWIGKIAYNTCINYLEKFKVSLYDDISAEDLSLEDISGNSISPNELTEKHDISFRIQYEIDSLPVHYRTILTLYHVDEMRYHEIAEVMALPEGTVKNYLFRARKLLKNRLMSKYTQEELWH